MVVRLRLDRSRARAGGYAYKWAGATPLDLGDRVVLPHNWLSQGIGGERPTGEVIGFGTDYTGDLATIVGRA